jgi:hypothetical protein
MLIHRLVWLLPVEQARLVHRLYDKTKKDAPTCKDTATQHTNKIY